jgi:hypothetical protein
MVLHASGVVVVVLLVTVLVVTVLLVEVAVDVVAVPVEVVAVGMVVVVVAVVTVLVVVEMVVLVDNLHTRSVEEVGSATSNSSSWQTLVMTHVFSLTCSLVLHLSTHLSLRKA